MARGKHLSLEEARKLGKLDRFCKEHPSTADAERFERLLDLVMAGKPASGEASDVELSGDCAGPQTQQGTSEDVSG